MTNGEKRTHSRITRVFPVGRKRRMRMKKFIIAAEDACDLPKIEVESRDIAIMPLHFVIGGEEHVAEQLGIHAFYEKLRAGERSMTSQGNLSDYEAFWRPYLEQGQDVLHIALSSAISGTYNNACKVAEKMKKEFPDRKVFVVDSRTASTGFGLFVTLLADYRDAGHTVDECYQYAMDTRLKINVIFTVDDLKTLVSTGRVKASEAFIGRMLQIKPILFINDLGELKPFWKVVSRKVSLKFLCDRTKTKLTPDTKTIIISHGDAPADADFCVEYLKNGLDPAIDVKVWDVGPVIGSHTGPNVMIFAYVSDDRIVKPY